MTPQELILKCHEQIKLTGETASVALVMRGHWGNRNYRKLFGIKGEIISECGDNELLVVFPAKPLMEAAIQELYAA